MRDKPDDYVVPKDVVDEIKDMQQHITDKHWRAPENRRTIQALRLFCAQRAEAVLTPSGYNSFKKLVQGLKDEDGATKLSGSKDAKISAFLVRFAKEQSAQAVVKAAAAAGDPPKPFQMTKKDLRDFLNDHKDLPEPSDPKVVVNKKWIEHLQKMYDSLNDKADDFVLPEETAEEIKDMVTQVFNSYWKPPDGRRTVGKLREEVWDKVGSFE